VIDILLPSLEIEGKMSGDAEFFQEVVVANAGETDRKSA
jgi:hypothetical protein